MSELRQDPISGQWVIIAPERAGRPDDFSRDGDARPRGDCPFCGGNEHLTSTPLLEIPAEAGARAAWNIRVLPNKYPAVSLGEESTELNTELKGTVPFSLRETTSQLLRQKLGQSPALGHHEVVVESPDHLLSITQLGESHFTDVVRVYRDRLRELKRDPRLVCALVFKNMGSAGGATLEHVHSQIVALPTVHERLRAELNGAAQWRERHGTCAYCAMIERERADGARIVAETPALVAVSPFAARMPYETWILPRQHSSHFEDLSDSAVAELAGLLKPVVTAIEDACIGSLDQAGAYNYFIHSAPFDTPAGDHYHWHVEIIPRMTRLAGFEWGTGWHINPVTPEAAAHRLRKLLGRAEEKRSSAASLPIS